MKKLLIFTLVALMLLTSLASCRMETHDYFGEELDKNPEQQPLPPSEVMKPDPEHPDNEQTKEELPAPDYHDPATDIVEIPATGDKEQGELALKHKIFTYQDHNLVVMRVENHSEQNLTVTVKGSCKSADGQSMTINKKFEGFAANWQNYILFYPQFAFDQFEYEVEIDPYSGEPYSQYIHNLKYDGLWLTPKYYYDGRENKVVMNGGWTFDYEAKYDAWYAAEFVYFDMNGKQDIFETDTVVVLDGVAEDGIGVMDADRKKEFYQNILHRTVGVDLNTEWRTLGFTYDNSLGKLSPYFPQYDTVVPYNPPEPFDDFQGVVCWNAIGKYGTQPPMGDFTYWPNWIEQVPPPGA